jgi:hypothetical protein
MERKAIRDEESTRRPRKTTLADKRKANRKDCTLGYQKLADIMFNGAAGLPKR